MFYLKNSYLKQKLKTLLKMIIMHIINVFEKKK